MSYYRVNDLRAWRLMLESTWEAIEMSLANDPAFVVFQKLQLLSTAYDIAHGNPVNTTPVFMYAQGGFVFISIGDPNTATPGTTLFQGTTVADALNKALNVVSNQLTALQTTLTTRLNAASTSLLDVNSALAQ